MEQQPQVNDRISLLEERLLTMQTVAQAEPEVWRNWVSDVMQETSRPDRAVLMRLIRLAVELKIV